MDNNQEYFTVHVKSRFVDSGGTSGNDDDEVVIDVARGSINAFAARINPSKCDKLLSGGEAHTSQRNVRTMTSPFLVMITCEPKHLPVCGLRINQGKYVSP